MEPIFLIGMMGSGKTTLGKALSRATGKRLIDLDNYIECRYHANVRDIFAREGESAFRDKERRMLRETGEFEDILIACGGGTPCFFDNMDFMNSRGLTVWLDAGEQRVYERLLVGRYKRPSISSLSDEELLDFIRRQREERLEFYGKAKLKFDSSRLDSADEIEESVGKFINLISNCHV